MTDLAGLRARLTSGELTSVDLTAGCLARIDALNPLVRAVLALDPTAEEQAVAADARRVGDEGPRGPLDGIPVLVKDNVDTAGLASTAGSRVMMTAPARDAAVVTLLRSAGAVVLGKTNLSEWGNFRSAASTEGWSGVGGQTRNPYGLERSPAGSSAGSAVAVATGMAPLAIGTETDGSIVGPAGVNGVVGVKPERGLLPMGGVARISPAQDCVGPLATCVRDAADLLTALTGRGDLRAEPVPLAGRRLGVWRPHGLADHGLRCAAAALGSAGAVLVPVDLSAIEDLVLDEILALRAELGPSLESYLRSRRGVPQTLAGVIAANRADPVELGLFGQDVFEEAAAMSRDDREVAVAGGRQARDRARALLTEAVRRHGVDAILAPSNPPAWPIDHARGDGQLITSSTPAALAGYPNISVPAGFVDGLPLGVSLFGPSRLAGLLPLASAVEGACAARRPPVLGADPHRRVSHD